MIQFSQFSQFRSQFRGFIGFLFLITLDLKSIFSTMGSDTLAPYQFGSNCIELHCSLAGVVALHQTAVWPQVPDSIGVELFMALVSIKSINLEVKQARRGGGGWEAHGW